jgi:hypothetical protein
LAAFAAISLPFFSKPLNIILYLALAKARAIPRPIPLHKNNEIILQSMIRRERNTLYYR